jgi:GR25 family glycosyltransferase involved in LPS biosynthesis
MCHQAGETESAMLKYLVVVAEDDVLLAKENAEAAREMVEQLSRREDGKVRFWAQSSVAASPTLFSGRAPTLLWCRFGAEQRALRQRLSQPQRMRADA